MRIFEICTSPDIAARVKLVSTYNTDGRQKGIVVRIYLAELKYNSEAPPPIYKYADP